jgi:pimeloyl-ACP methyl ester carboxylesterase
VSLVSGDLELAARDGPLVVVAHSMGGNIAYDILSHFRPDLHIDTLVTVGTQVGLFEELKLFASSNRDLPTPAVPRLPALPNVDRWINVVDRGDVLAYRADPIFDGVDDYEYPSDAPWAHGAYFRQPNFHERLASRVQKARS